MTLATNKKSFVLVHGAYHGAWCWERLAALLVASGARVCCPTLTGLGERHHLMSKEITIDTHCQDLAEAIGEANFHDAVLVGHSYGGLIASAVVCADKSCCRSVCYLDAFTGFHGGWSSFHSPEEIRVRAELAVRHDGGLSLPAPSPEVFGVTDPQDVAWLRSRLTPHPYRTYSESVGVLHPPDVDWYYVDLERTMQRALSEEKRRIRAQYPDRYFRLPAGHLDPVLAPGTVAEFLLQIA